jgi:hypothetical protein
MTGIELFDLIGKYAGTAVTTFVAGGAGAYFVSYLKKKGENLATHEDIDKLVAQVTAVTQATKEIEAKISNDAWGRQRRWEVRRDALFDVVRELNTIQYAMERLNTVAIRTRTSSDPSGFAEEFREANRFWNDTTLTFRRAKGLALLVAGKDVRDAMDQLDKLFGKAMDDITWDTRKPGWYEGVIAAADSVSAAIRKELNID